MSPRPEWDPYSRLLTIEEAAESVARPPSTLRRWISEGRLRPRAAMGRRRLLLESDVLEVDAATRRPRSLPAYAMPVSTAGATLRVRDGNDPGEERP